MTTSPFDRIETFQCATGSGWGVLVNNLMDTDIPYAATEAGALANARAAYPNALRILTTDFHDHYSHRP